MKVIHLVLSDSFGGIEQHVDELLSNKLIKNPILITNKSISNNFNKNISIHNIKNIGKHSLYGKHKLNKLLKKLNPDIIHTHCSKTTSIVSSINRNRYKHVATIHGIKKNKKIYEKADFVIGVSQKSIDEINNNSKVISNWWYPKLTKFNTSKNDYALAVGRLEKVKGFDLLISSWVNIKSNLIIVGSGKEKQKLIDLINKLNLNKKIKIIENVKRNDLVNYYRNASVLIVPSRDEGGPRVALEALYLEVPVLSTNVGHMDSILPQELLAKKNDQESLQKLLETYVDDIGLLNQDAIFEFITEEFSVQDKILQTHEVYESLINNR